MHIILFLCIFIYTCISFFICFLNINYPFYPTIFCILRTAEYPYPLLKHHPQDWSEMIILMMAKSFNSRGEFLHTLKVRCISRVENKYLFQQTYEYSFHVSYCFLYHKFHKEMLQLIKTTKIGKSNVGSAKVVVTWTL